MRVSVSVAARGGGAWWLFVYGVEHATRLAPLGPPPLDLPSFIFFLALTRRCFLELPARQHRDERRTRVGASRRVGRAVCAEWAAGVGS